MNFFKNLFKSKPKDKFETLSEKLEYIKYKHKNSYVSKHTNDTHFDFSIGYFKFELTPYFNNVYVEDGEDKLLIYEETIDLDFPFDGFMYNYISGNWNNKFFETIDNIYNQLKYENSEIQEQQKISRLNRLFENV